MTQSVDPDKAIETSESRNLKTIVVITVLVIASVCLVLGIFAFLIFDPDVADPPEVEDVVPDSVEDRDE